MKLNRLALITALIFTVSSMIGCSYIGDNNHQTKAATTETRVAVLFGQMPRPPGVVLLDQYNGSTGGQIQECAGRQIQALFGANDLSFSEVLDFYSRSMKSLGWEPISADQKGRDFQNNGFVLDISNLYDVSMLKKTIVNDSKSKFKTIYLIELITSVEHPVPGVCGNR